MTKFCIVCKKQYVPGLYTSSFHCIPKNDEQRAKWMQIIGITNYPANARVCSDHFESSSYHPDYDYRSNMRKLLPNALPTLTNKIFNSQVSSNKKCFIFRVDNTNSTGPVMIPLYKTVQKNENNFSIPFVEVKDENDDASNDSEEIEEFSPVASPEPDSNGHPKFVIECRQNVAIKGNNVYEDSCYWPERQVYSTDKQDSTVNSHFQTEVENDLQQSNVDYSTNNALKRINTAKKRIISESHDEFVSGAIDNANMKKKRSCGDLNALLWSVKKFKWKDGTTTNSLIRQDFTSEKAWHDFLQFTNFKRKQMEALAKKCWRRDKTVKRLKDTIKALNGKRVEDAESLSLSD